MPKLPPHSVDAEQAVLGALLTAPDKVGRKVMDLLAAPRVFWLEQHQEIFRAIRSLWDNGRPVELQAVFAGLESGDAIDDARGRGYVADLANSVADPDSAPYHAAIVADKFRLRELIFAAQQIMDLAYDAEDAASAIDAAESLIYPLRPPAIEQDITGSGVLSGFPAIDGIVGGFRPGNLIVVGALTSMGKTAFGLAVSRNVATGSGGQVSRSVLYVSLEMSAPELASRLMCAEGSVSTARARRGSLTVEDWRRLYEAKDTLETWPLWIEDRRGLTVPQIARLARDLSREQRGPLGLVVIDYLGLLGATSSKKAQSREQEVSEVSRGLKAMAGEIGSPVMALAQFNRAAESDKDGVGLRHFRDSGSIEQDADVAMLLVGEKESSSRISKVAKNRGGPLGEIELYFAGRYTRMESLVSPKWRPAV